MLVAVALVVGAVASLPHSHQRSTPALLPMRTADGAPNCTASDEALQFAREVWCASVVGWTCEWCPSPENFTHWVHKDWPNQAVYFHTVLHLLATMPDVCLTTPYVNDTAVWLQRIQSNISLGGTLVQTWAAPTGQPNYYEMPRKPGARIESPWTLGMKCWAFAYLRQSWNSSARAFLTARLAAHAMPIGVFAAQYEAAGPLTTRLCEEVMVNCFVNQSYDPRRNGTCPLSVLDFRAGFAWQNTIHGSPIHYPFPG